MSTEHGPRVRRPVNTLAEFERDLADNLCYERGTTAESASLQDAYWTLAVTVRDRLAHRRARTARANYLANPKFVYYLSAEYMLGRQLHQNMLYTGTADLARPALDRNVGYGTDSTAAPALFRRPPGWLRRGRGCLRGGLRLLRRRSPRGRRDRLGQCGQIHHRVVPPKSLAT
jgi:hypothetical protein